MKYLDTAMEAARSLGADYADIRIQKSTAETIYLHNLSLKNTSTDITEGYGIRVFKNGAWGFAHSNLFSEDQVAATVKRAMEIALLSAQARKGNGMVLAAERSYIASYRTPVTCDPDRKSVV